MTVAMHMHVTVLLSFSPSCPHQWVGEWQGDKTSEERWGRKDERCHSAQMLLQSESSPPLQSFTISCGCLREQTVDDEGNSRQNGFQSHTASFHCSCVIIVNFWNVNLTTTNEQAIDLPPGWVTHINKTFHLPKLNTINPIITAINSFFVVTLWWK